MEQVITDAYYVTYCVVCSGIGCLACGYTGMSCCDDPLWIENETDNDNVGQYA